MVLWAAEDGPSPEEYERVYVESDWYDGPRGGLADVGGVVHYFKAVQAYDVPGTPDDEYYVWPASPTAFDWEQERWSIFVAWNDQYEAGLVVPSSHPGHGGLNSRWDELEALLAPHRRTPDHARLMLAEWRSTHVTARRYHVDGPDYRVRWRSDR